MAVDTDITHCDVALIGDHESKNPRFVDKVFTLRAFLRTLPFPDFVCSARLTASCPSIKRSDRSAEVFGTGAVTLSGEPSGTEQTPGLKCNGWGKSLVVVRSARQLIGLGFINGRCQ